MALTASEATIVTKTSDISFLTPVKYPSRRGGLADDELTLTMILVLRRVRAGSSAAAAARSLNLPERSVQQQLLRARSRAGVRTTSELLDLPSVRAQLGEDS